MQSLLSQERVDTDFKFGWYIHSVHLNKSPLKILEKMEHGRMQDLPKFFSVHPVIPGMGNAIYEVQIW